MYRCSECNTEAVQKAMPDGAVKYERQCACDTGNIVMEMTGTAYGRGSIR